MPTIYPPAPNTNIDLTDLQAVKDYAQISSGNDDNLIQLAITAFSEEFIRMTGRSNMDGSTPTKSPFLFVQYFDEWYDGSGTERQFVRNWPIYGALSSPSQAATPTVQGYPNLYVNGQQVPYSPNVPGSTSFSNGFTIDGSGKSLAMRLPGINTVTPYLNPYFLAATNFLGTCYLFAPGTQNVEIQYWAGFAVVPTDIIRVATQVAAINYKRASWIDQASKSLSAGGGATGTTRYRDWRIPPECEHVVEYYTRSAIV